MFRKFLASTLPIALMAYGATTAIANPKDLFKVRGPKVITYPVAQVFGGVVLQGSAEFQTSTQQSVSVDQLKLRLSDNKVCVEDSQNTCYAFETPDETAIHLAKLALTGKTGVFSDSNPGDDYEPVIGGYITPELNHHLISTALYDMDYDGLIWDQGERSELKESYNLRNGFAPNFTPPLYEIIERSSFLHTDNETDQIAVLANNQVEMKGSVNKWHLEKYQQQNEVYITQVDKACEPEDIKEYNTQNCSALNDFGFNPYTNDFESGEYIVPYMVIGNSTESFLAEDNNQKITNTNNILLSIPEFNARRFRDFAWVNKGIPEFSHVQWKTEEEDFLLQWEDTIGGGDGDFSDLKINVRTSMPESELVPVPEATGVFQINGPTNIPLYLTFEVAAKNAAHNISEFGFFKVDDADGSVNGLKPSDPGYLDVALGSDRHHIVISHDDILEDIAEYYPRQKNAIDLVRATASFRKFADDNPQELRRFIREASR